MTHTYAMLRAVAAAASVLALAAHPAASGELAGLKTTKALDRYVSQPATPVAKTASPTVDARKHMAERHRVLTRKLATIRYDLDLLITDAENLGCTFSDDAFAAQIGLPDPVSGVVEAGKASKAVVDCVSTEPARRKQLLADIEFRKRELMRLLTEASDAACGGDFWQQITAMLFGVDGATQRLGCRAGDIVAPPLAMPAPNQPSRYVAGGGDDADLQIRMQTHVSDRQNAQNMETKLQNGRRTFCKNCAF